MLKNAFSILLRIGLLLGATHCSAPEAADEVSNATELRPPPRDWEVYPPIVEIDDDCDEIYAMSDVHGRYDVFVQLLTMHRLVDQAADDPSEVHWTGGRAFLVLAGDAIDKGGESLKVIDLLKNLQVESEGRVIVTMGNHEAEFLANPENDKSMSSEHDNRGIGTELEEWGISPRTLVMNTDSAGRGRWLSNLPFGARMRNWFFSHGGNTEGRTLEALAQKLQNSVDHHGYDDKDITGEKSLLEAQKWYGDPDDHDAGVAYAWALGVDHLAFGHDPGAFDDRGRIRLSRNDTLAKLDVGLGESNEPGRAALLHIVRSSGVDSVEVVNLSGSAD